jgi:hypothetical protein
MCLPDSCVEGLGRGTTYYDDLFAAQATLTDEQMLVENTSLAMATEDRHPGEPWRCRPTNLPQGPHSFDTH